MDEPQNNTQNCVNELNVHRPFAYSYLKSPGVDLWCSLIHMFIKVNITEECIKFMNYEFDDDPIQSKCIISILTQYNYK